MAVKSIAFVTLTFAISWGIVGVGALVRFDTNPIAAFYTLFAMMFGPSIAALVCALTFERGHVLDALGLKWTPNWWWLIAWLSAFALGALSIGFTILFSHAAITDPAQSVVAQVAAQFPQLVEKVRRIPLSAFDAILVGQVIVLGSLINIPALVITEELGWRGYLHYLWRPFGFWRTSLATGAIWGLWHAPAIYIFGLNYPNNRLIGIPLFVLFCTLLAPIMTFFRDRGRSVIAPAILHAMINASAGYAALLIAHATFPWNGVVGIGGFLALALDVLVLALATRQPAAP
jgi:membrane protease YdiL (CAAX protease family)